LKIENPPNVKPDLYFKSALLFLALLFLLFCGSANAQTLLAQMSPDFYLSFDGEAVLAQASGKLKNHGGRLIEDGLFGGGN
jgi:hypothetical protein